MRSLGKKLLFFSIVVCIALFIFLLAYMKKINTEGSMVENKKEAGVVTNCLELTLEMNKTVFNYQEPITVKAILKNVCDKSVTVYQSFDYAIYFDITDKSGKQLRWLPFTPPPPLTNSNFYDIQPHSELSYDKKIIENDLFDKILPGHYNIAATYKNNEPGNKFGIIAWTGELKSNPISFEVIP